MRLLSLNVQNVRGLTELQLTLDGKNIVIWGPNGAGKSCVIDAIDFLVTGRVSRLMGEGTAGISLARHGPHIDHDPKSAIVTARIQLEVIPQPFDIRRCMARPNDLECPDEARASLANVSDLMRRGGVILTRRDILRFIATEAGTRADQIQELLNLKEIDDVRSSLYRARTELTSDEKNAQKAIETQKAEVNVTLGTPQYSDEALHEVVRASRRTLGGVALDAHDSAVFKAGIVPPVARESGAPSLNRIHFEQVLKSILELTHLDSANALEKNDKDLRMYITNLRANPELLAELEHLELTTSAVRLVDDSTVECPVCGASWPEGHLRTHLEAKITAAKAAQAASKKILEYADALATPARNLHANVEALRNTVSTTHLGGTLRQELDTLDSWLNAINALLTALGRPIETYLDCGFSMSDVARMLAPEGLNDLLRRVEIAVQRALPEPTPEQTAWDTLTQLQVSVRALENRRRERDMAHLYSSRSKALLSAYESARDAVLGDLYRRIAERFVAFYRFLHDHEGPGFGATLQPKGAALNFEVDFLGRGAHPPNALHSEGHQDSMGVCLFLALNEELAKGQPTFVVFDDVMMSVDSGHRKDLCRLLKDQFPDCQFVITTHDKTWAKQLKQERVVEPDRVIEFTGWTVETGPRTHQQMDLWTEIEADLDRGDIPNAAFKLRRGSEDFFENVCDALGVAVTYNTAMQWQLDDWLPATMERYKKLLQRARRAAVSWDDNVVIDTLAELESVRKQVYDRTKVEEWAINSAVHYNSWENMSQRDFSPVTDAFRDLHGLFSCSGCGRLLEKLPRKGLNGVVKCPCAKTHWNLRQNPQKS